MVLTVNPLHATFVAEISGLDLRQPLAQSEVADIVSAMNQFSVCIFRHDRPLTDQEHIAFTRNFGPLQRRSPARPGRPLRLAPELADAGNIDEQGNVLPENDRRRQYSRGNELWHTDASFNAVRATYSVLSAHIIPPRDSSGSGNTDFADTRAAYAALPNPLKEKIANLVAKHSIWHSRALAGFPGPTDEELMMRPPSQYKLVNTHPLTGRKALYIAAHISEVIGMPKREGEALVRMLMDFATQPQFVYSHEWRVGDVVMWDNFCTMHRARPCESARDRRDLRRATVLEAEEQHRAAV